MGRKKNQCWSYNAGERGCNWVRAYENGPGGVILLEWMEPRLGEDGEPLVDPVSGDVLMRRARVSTKHRDRSRARKQAEEMAERLATTNAAAPASTLRRLFHLYLREVSPKRSASKHKGDGISARAFLAYLGTLEEKRGPNRHPSTLDRQDWEGYVEARKTGKVPGFRPVKNNQIRLDLKFVLTVLHWASGAEEDAPHHLAANPWRWERRRAQNMAMPKEKDPKRPGISDETHARLVKHSPNWRFALVCELCRETLHRSNSVRHLRWEDVDLASGHVRWRGEYDKTGRESVVPLSPGAVAALKAAPRVLGSPWVVPAETDPSRPVSNRTLNAWMRRAKERAGIAVERLGFHAYKRAGVRTPEFRALPPKVQEQLTGTTARILREVYDDVPLDELAEAMQTVAKARRRA